MIDLSLAALLNTILKSYPGQAPDNPETPYCVFERAASSPDNLLAGIPESEGVRFRIDIHAATYAAARGYAVRVKAALMSAPFGGYVTDDAMIYESVVGFHRCVIEFEARDTY